MSVLIVGAGPTGLTLAVELLKFGITPRIIDRSPEPKQTSRAFTLHARTLELFYASGISDMLIEKGIRVDSMDYHFPQMEETPGLDFTKLDTFYPFCVNISQRVVESTLHQWLAERGCVIEWGTQLVGFVEGEKVSATLKNVETEKVEESLFEYVVGCDGFYSKVRRLLNLEYEGFQYAGEMQMMDVSVSGFEGDSSAIHYFIKRDNMLLVAKLPGDMYRVLFSFKTQNETVLSKEYFQEKIDEHFGGKVVIGEPEWITRFLLDSRQINDFKAGNIFLAGDAAHINSPAGGQGMNVSIQDAFNLGWKLAHVIEGHAPESLLDSYSTERLPIASQMLQGTKYLHDIIMAHGSGMEERIALTKAPGWNKKAVSQVSGVSYTYKNVDNEEPLSVGDRATDAEITSTLRLYDVLSPVGYTVVFFVSETTQAEEMLSIGDKLVDQFKVPIKIVAVLNGTTETQENEQILFDECGITSRYQENSVVVIRPDKYISFVSGAEGNGLFESFEELSFSKGK